MVHDLDERRRVLVTGTEERNLAAIRAYFDAQNVSEMVAAFSEDTRNHGRPVGRAGVALVLQDIHDTFPDTNTTIEEIVAIGDQVIARLTVSGPIWASGAYP